MADTKPADAKAPEPKAGDPKSADHKAPEPRPADPKAAPGVSVQELAAAIRQSNQINAGAASATADADKTVPGGKFLDVRTGKFINCNGREIDEDGNVLRPEELVMDPFGRLV
jgi:hypothetical protein